MSLTIEAPARLPEEIVVLNPHGDVTVTEFFDYFCHVCQRIGAELQEIAREDGNIRVVYREFPIINGQESVMLSRLALATYNQGIYLDVHNAFMEAHGRLDFDGAVRIIQGLGGDIRELERDFRDQQIIEKTASQRRFWRLKPPECDPKLHHWPQRHARLSPAAKGCWRWSPRCAKSRLRRETEAQQDSAAPFIERARPPRHHPITCAGSSPAAPSNRVRRSVVALDPLLGWVEVREAARLWLRGAFGGRLVGLLPALYQYRRVPRLPAPAR